MAEALSVESVIPTPVGQLLDERSWSKDDIHGEVLTCRTPEGHDVYNITSPFTYEGRRYIIGRSEERQDEVNTVSRFFVQDENGNWNYDERMPTFALQDPFVTRIQDKWIVGGVRVSPSENNAHEVENWETYFFEGDDLRNLHTLRVGPEKMKDIRPVELADGRILIFTRPQSSQKHDIGGKGTIGYMIVNDLEEFRHLDNEKFWQAPLLKDMFAEGEWGGVNAAYPLEDGQIGVLGHIARRVNGEREYYPMTFVFDPEAGMVSEQQIIADPDCFPSVDAKKSDLKHVLFSGGLEVTDDPEVVTWYGGKSDTSAVRARIHNPFGAKIIRDLESQPAQSISNEQYTQAA